MYVFITFIYFEKLYENVTREHLLHIPVSQSVPFVCEIAHWSLNSSKDPLNSFMGATKILHYC